MGGDTSSGRGRIRDPRVRLGLALAVAAVIVIAVVVLRPVVERYRRGYTDTQGIEIVRYRLQSRLLDRGLAEIALVPPGAPGGRGLLVLLHGRNEKGPRSLLSDALFEALARLGDRAPVVVLLNGGSHSYYHDRDDGPWGSMILSEAIPDAVRLFGTVPGRVAIGGISMGGFGALHLAARAPGRFCAVGAHSAALWFKAGDTPDGAFDDAEDYARVDVWRSARAGRYVGTPVWIDVGSSDGFRNADVAFAKLLRERRAFVEQHEWPGGHNRSYWRAHTASYLRFYASALQECAR